jgi:hypothetical protein
MEYKAGFVNQSRHVQSQLCNSSGGKFNGIVRRERGLIQSFLKNNDMGKFLSDSSFSMSHFRKFKHENLIFTGIICQNSM